MKLNELFAALILVFPHKELPKPMPLRESKFDKAIIQVLKNEGGLVNDKNDNGGITNYGISYRFLKNAVAHQKDLISKVDMNGNKIIDSYDIIHMTKREAESIYQEEWWDKYGYGKITYQSLATKIFDMSINMGPQRAANFLRKACLSFNYPLNIKNTPELSMKEINFINSLSIQDKNKIINNLISLSVDFYQSLAKNDPSQQKFLRGWLKRARETF